ncbi:hypothetical protein KP509_34G030900 [Ceratopteris richardii]|uniref:Pentatricopeptide repeat-containing protein n=1 Tax=Ceratopteris richardii TaxID=49495 RepID=A0A8T2QKG8_CERRI|nr:hypothetical protein KP509_34G030900 [Ceratopteris richardii]
MKTWPGRDKRSEITHLEKLLQQHRQCPTILSKRTSLVILLQACSSLPSLADGLSIHGDITLLGLETDTLIANCLITMYGNCLSVMDAQDVFLRLKRRNVVTWTAMTTVFIHHDRSLDALLLFYQMQSHRVQPTKVTFASVITACASIKSFEDGCIAHAYLVELGFHTELAVNNALISMYGKFGCSLDAQHMFDSVNCRDVVTWTSIIGAYTQRGQCKDALQIFHGMLLSDVKPNAVTLVNILSACAADAAMIEGMAIHFSAIESGLDQNSAVINTFLIFYGNVGCVEGAMNMFSSIKQPDPSNWTTMMSVCNQHEQHLKSWHLFDLMQEKGMKINKVTMITVLNACISVEALVKGQAFHSCIINYGYDLDVTVMNALIGMYSRCHGVDHAEATFLQMVRRDIVSFTSMIVAYIQCEFYMEAIELLQAMREECIRPDKVAFISILSACIKSEALELGRIVHDMVLECVCNLDNGLYNAILMMYGRCGSISCADNIFKRMQSKDIVSWNAMLAFWTEIGNADVAFHLFWKMNTAGIEPSAASFVSIITSCTGESTPTLGRLFHVWVVDSGLELDSMVSNSLVTMYGKFSSLVDAKCVFDSVYQNEVVAWTSMISSYAKHGDSNAVLSLYYKMQSKGVKPDKFIFSVVVAACSGSEMLQDGINVHKSIIQNQVEVDIVLVNALINMYCKCGSVESAKQVFAEMHEHNLFSFNAIIGAYSQLLSHNEALEAFVRMQIEGIQPDSVSYLGMLVACSGLADLKVGRMIHALVLNSGFECDDAVSNAMISMYSKCGSVECAYYMFESLSEKSIAAWASMITAFADHGDIEKVLKLFNFMVNEGVEPNETSFVGILAACSRAGLIDHAFQVLLCIGQAKGGLLCGSHFGCIIDLLTRAGLLQEAEFFLSIFPFHPGIVEWMTLLSASKNFNNLQSGKQAANYLTEIDEDCAVAYIVLGNSYVY